MVYMKLQPYVQSSLAPRANQKLPFCYFGPFKILSRIGAVAYKLELPATSTIHLVFHLSQLKKALASSEDVAQLPVDLDSLQVPKKILCRRICLMVSLRSSSNGLVCHNLLLLGRISKLCCSAFHTLLLRDKQVFFRGNVSAVSTVATDGQVRSATVGRATEQGRDVGPRRGDRPRKASSRVTDPNWV